MSRELAALSVGAAALLASLCAGGCTSKADKTSAEPSQSRAPSASFQKMYQGGGPPGAASAAGASGAQGQGQGQAGQGQPGAGQAGQGQAAPPPGPAGAAAGPGSK
jgi:hypothetical protein